MTFIAVRPLETDLCITRLIGVINDRQLRDYYRGRLEAGTFKAGGVEVVDGRAIERFEITASGHRDLVHLFEDHPEATNGVRWAFIATTPMAFGMFRMFEAQAHRLPFTVIVFRSVEDAAAWLDVPPTIFDYSAEDGPDPQ